jgi:two-component system LytT family response regulator
MGAARNGREALDLTARLRPDLLFLDVQMPELDGLGVVAALDPGTAPAIIFVTAFDRYAIEAFNLHAVDYLLKPFDDERCRTALSRALERIAARGGARFDPRVSAWLAAARPAKSVVERLAVRQNGRTVFVAVAEIDWIEAADNYARLHTKAGSFLLRETIRHLAEELDPVFVRIHRSSLVRLDQVREVRPQADGDQTVVLASGVQLVLTRSWRDHFEARAGKPR